MAEQKKQRGTDESVTFERSRLPINPEAEQNPVQEEMDGRNSQRLSADLPYGLPTNDTHPTGTPAREISSGFSDLKSGQIPTLEDDNAQNREGEGMKDENRNQNQPRSGSARNEAEQRRKEPTYDAEKEMPDAEQVERDRAEAERQYGNEKKSA